MNLVCPKCGLNINDNDAFCSHCGEQIVSNISLSKAQKIKVYVLSFLLAPFGLYWFFKYRKENDPEKILVAKRVLWITIATILFMLISSIMAANSYSKLLNGSIYGYGF
jgi:uncharacterized membrane protein YvbJ